MEFLESLIIVSEKAANLARTIRQNERLFKLLVEQKSVTDSNPRFITDFKTLADVLIQEMVKNDMGLKFPHIKDKIFGEESNEFTNQLGEKILVEIKEDEQATSRLLKKVLEGDEKTANLLAAKVHEKVYIEDINTRQISNINFKIDVNNLGIWIDPIDATNEYVNAEEKGKIGDINLSGLQCVTILIGAFDVHSSLPVIGVVNQPFLEKQQFRYQCHWGFCIDQDKMLEQSDVCSLSSIDCSKREETKIICVSSGEDPAIKRKLNDAGYTLIETCGAGYKLLNVILGLVDAYILSKPTTYYWDTCGPQAILRSMGGNIVNYHDAANFGVKTIVTSGLASSHTTSHKKGIIAFREEHVLDQIIKVLYRPSDNTIL